MKKKVLIIDDDRDLVGAMQEVLQAHGYAVATAHDGESGFACAQKQRPDLLLLDVMMTHDTEGFDLVQRLRTDQALAKLPIIMITGIRKAKGLPFKYEPDDEWLPVAAVLEKPVPPERLLQHVATALSGAQAK